jgi:hypothetical protein
MVQPNDSVFNTRIDTLPLNSNSASWVAAMGPNPAQFDFAWGTNILDNTSSATPQVFYYTTLANGQFQIPVQPARKREGGSLTLDGNNDHHMVSLNHQTCHYYETYQEAVTNTGVPNLHGIEWMAVRFH